MPRLPRPPRTVRRRAALATWWFAGCTSAGLLLGAILFLTVWLAGDGFRLPFADWRLDAAPARAGAPGRVVAVHEPEPGLASPRDLVAAQYAFRDAAGRERDGRCWMPRGAVAAGDPCAVEWLPDDPDVHRLRGGSRSRAALWLPALAGLWLLPAVLVTGLWAARAFRTWVLLRHGRAAPATLQALRRARGAGSRLCVRYAFAGDDGQRHEAWQHVRRHGALGRELTAAEPGAELEHALCVHQEGRPRLCRLVHEDDVAEATA
jgi:hypothetical protein